MMKLKQIAKEMLENSTEIQKLLEGINYTHNIDTSIRIIERYGILAERDRIYKVNTGGYTIFIHDIPEDEKLKKKLTQLYRLGENLGYYAAIAIINNRHRIKNLEVSNILKAMSNEKFHERVKYKELRIKFEARYDMELPIQDIYYHAAPERILPKILKLGLIPKANWRKNRHPERVYMAVDKDAALNIAEAFEDTDEKHNDYVILKINTKKIGKPIVVFDDPNYHRLGVYTYNNIPPKAITQIK